MTEQEQNKTIDWGKEAKGLKEAGSNWFKPKTGMNQIVFLSNGESVKGKDFNGKEVEKIRFLISSDKNQYHWDVTKTSNKTSLYGQIATFASKKGGLSGIAALLNVTGEGQAKRYTLIDPATLISGGGQ